MNKEIPKLTSFEDSPFQRERDCMAYIAETIKMLGWDGGKELDTMDNWLYRLRKKVTSFHGSEFVKINNNITLGCISPEARDLLDTIMIEWDKYLIELKKSNGENYEPSYYGFAYWLVR